MVLLYALQTIAQKQNSIGFIENKGQIVDQKGKENKSVLYLLNTHGLNVQLKKNGFSYDVYEVKKHPLPKQKEDKLPLRSFIKQDTLKSPNFNLEYIYHRIDIDFVNSNLDVKLVSEEKSVDYDNYYNVVHAPNGITNVHKYQKVTYQNIYDNIDVAFFIPTDSTKTVEYNFIVKPGGKISDIQLKFNGAKTELADNKIKMQVRFGEMEETLPLSWIENGATRKELAVGYRQIKKNVYGFMGDVNSLNKTIVIDPVPVRLWGTYYGNGGNSYEGTSLSVDDYSNSYYSGSTTSSYNIATSGSYQPVLSGTNDGFIVKFDTNGIRLWGTYFGGSDRDNINATDIKNDNLIITGTTWSSNNIATNGTHSIQYNPGNAGTFSRGDCYIAKMNLDGFKIWGTYFGGEGNDYPINITIDLNNNIIVTGSTFSLTGISTPGSFKETRTQPVNINTTGEGFIAKFNENGNLTWSTYYGLCDIRDVGTDSNSNVFISGDTSSANSNPYISTPGTHQPNFSYNTQTGDSYHDSFIGKFDSSGQRIWGTYYGGYQAEYNFSLKIDSEDNIYISGHTRSNELISTPGSHQPTGAIGSDADAYLSKFDQNGMLIWGTYYGGSSQEHWERFTIDINNNDDVFLSGSTVSSNNISTSGTYSETLTGAADIFIVKFNKFGSRIWGTYFGGTSSENNKSIKLDNNGGIYIMGYTYSTNGIATSGSYQTTIVSSPSNFLVKFLDCQSAFIISANSPLCIGQNLHLTASGGTNYNWTGPNGFTSTEQNPTIINTNPNHSGIYTCAIIGTDGCDGTSTVTVTVGNTSPPVPTVATLPNITGDCNTSVTTPTATTACSGVINAITANPLTYNVPGTYAIVWNYIDGNGNTATQNQTVIITSQPVPTVTSPQTFCIQENATLNDIAITGQNIKWYDNQTVGNLLANTTQLQNNTTYYASQTISGCESNRIPVLINIQNTPAPTGSSSQSFCANLNPTLNNLVVQGTNLTWYDSFTGGSVLPLSTALINGATYHVSQTISGCESTVRLTVTVSLTNSLPANDYAESLCDALNDGSETVNLTNYNSNLIANPSDYGFFYFTSLAGAENELVSDQINNFSNYPLNLGINKVFVRIVSSTTCYKMVELKWTLIASPVIHMQNSYSLCENNSIAISAGPSNGYTYLWSTLEITPTIVVNQPSNYWVTVSENHNPLICSTRKDFTVVASNSATITNIITADWTNNENTITVLLSDSSIGNYEYSIDGVHYQDSNVFYGLISGAYTVFVKDKHDCGEVSQDLYLLMYPNFFTPNGDGINDHWSIKFSYFEPGLKVKIMDRYGKFITELFHNTSWDGTYNGKQLPATDYWFVVTRANGKEHRGHFTLKR